MYLRNQCLSSATLLAVAIVPNVSVMSFSHHCIDFPLLIFIATMPCIIVFSKHYVEYRSERIKMFDALQNYTASSFAIRPNIEELSRVYVICFGIISFQLHLFF